MKNSLVKRILAILVNGSVFGASSSQIAQAQTICDVIEQITSGNDAYTEALEKRIDLLKSKIGELKYENEEMRMQKEMACSSGVDPRATKQ